LNPASMLTTRPSKPLTSHKLIVFLDPL
jgi:hypothetical protein